MKFIYNIYLFFFFISCPISKCITEEILKTLDEKITDENLDIEVFDTKKILKEYDEFNKIFNLLVEREKKERRRKTFNEQKFKEEYKKMEKEANLFKKYFYKQRKKMSDYIDKKNAKVDKETRNLYHSTIERSLDVQDLIKSIEEKININKEDL